MLQVEIPWYHALFWDAGQVHVSRQRPFHSARGGEERLDVRVLGRVRGLQHELLIQRQLEAGGHGLHHRLRVVGTDGEIVGALVLRRACIVRDSARTVSCLIGPWGRHCCNSTAHGCGSVDTSQFDMTRGAAGRAEPELAIDHNFHGLREKKMFCSGRRQVRLNIEVRLLQLGLCGKTNGD